MTELLRAKDSLTLRLTGALPTVYTARLAESGATDPLATVSGVQFATAHDIRFDGLQPATTYTYGVVLSNERGEAVETLGGQAMTLADFPIEALTLAPQTSAIEITAQTAVPTSLTVYVAEWNNMARQDTALAVRRTFVLDGLAPDTTYTLTMVFTDQTGGEQVARYRARTRAIYTPDTTPPVFQHLAHGAQVLCQYTGDMLLGITAFLNAVKYNLRYAKLADYAPDAAQLEDRQIKAFEDQMSYYYANAARAQDAEVLVRLACEWFRYGNVDDLDPLAKPMTPEQKTAMLKIIKQVADNYVLSATIAQIKQMIGKLNQLELVPDNAPLRNAYNALGTSQLATPPKIDYLQLLDSGVTPLESVEMQ